MKKGLIKSYVSGIRDREHGEKYSQIIKYFIPEFITALVLYSFLYLLDARWIAELKSTTMYATLGMTNTFLHFIVKIAEGVSVGTIVLTGLHNGAGQLKQAGRSLVDAFWLNCLFGGIISVLLFFGAYWIYWLQGIPEDMIKIGIPFLRLRAIGIFFMFLYFAFIGFLRGIKNTKTPMKIFIVGAVVFLSFDYLLIFGVENLRVPLLGAFSIPKMGLLGSATASILQYAVMLLATVISLTFNDRYRKYSIRIFSVFSSGSQVRRLLQLSWRVMLDKATVAAAYIWLAVMIGSMGKIAMAAFTCVKDLERLALLPAVACAQVVTLLISNGYGIKDWDGIKANVKKIIFLSSIMVFSILIMLSMWPEFFVGLFDKNGDFTWLAARVLPMLSVLVFFDVLQLILAGAMRGASNVKTVMITRLLVCVGYFAPVSYILSAMPIQNPVTKFMLIYGSFYLGNALMSIAYINRFRGQEWKKQAS